MGRGGWTSEVLSRLIVGSPFPTTTGIGIVAGPAAVLPPPLDTYLIVGLAWVTQGTLAYEGIRFDAGLGDYIHEAGFVTSAGVIFPQVYSYENGPGVQTVFTGGSDVNFENTGGVNFWFPVNTPMAFIRADVTIYSDSFFTVSNGASTKHVQFRPAVEDLLFIGWDVNLDAASTLTAAAMTVESSGVFNGDFSFTITAYGTTTSAGVFGASSVVYTAPASGVVTLDFRGQFFNSVATSATYMSPETREGGSVGSGTIVQAAADTRAMVSGVTTGNPGQAWVSGFCIITGLTPGATYNSQLLHRVIANTGRCLVRELIVRPSL